MLRHLAVMNAVMARRVQNPPERADAADQTRMQAEHQRVHAERDSQVDRSRNAEQRERQIEWKHLKRSDRARAHQHGQIEGGGFVVDGVAGPQQRHSMREPVNPVVEEIVSHERQEPRAHAAGVELEQRETRVHHRVNRGQHPARRQRNRRAQEPAPEVGKNFAAARAGETGSAQGARFRDDHERRQNQGAQRSADRRRRHRWNLRAAGRTRS
jgi:hypothetical protein